ncbi:MAG: hypothetical protein ABSA21_13090 [Candidatus Limnocylindrales bacterium]
MLLVGKHDQEVADAIGVHRVTVTRWRLYHPQFQATLNERRAAAWKSSEDAYRVLLHDAVGALQEELGTPGPQRAKLALGILRSSPLPHADLAHPGPTDPEAVVDEVAKQGSTRELDRLNTLFVTDDDRRAILEDLLTQANEPPADDPRPDQTPKTRVTRAKAAKR